MPNFKQLPLTTQERSVIEEAFQPYMQAIMIVAKLRGLNPAFTQLSGDRSCFLVPEEAPVESNGIQQTLG